MLTEPNFAGNIIVNLASLPDFLRKPILKTWLEVLTTISEEQRTVLFSGYINEIVKFPQKLINFNLDGILEIFLSLDGSKKETLAKTIKKIISNLDIKTMNRLFLIIPDSAKSHIGF